MNGERELVRTDDYISTTLDGEEVILHRDSEKYFGLNAVGTRLWQLLEEPRTVDELVSVVQEDFDVSKERGQKDVETFLEDMEGADLVTTTDESGP